MTTGGPSGSATLPTTAYETLRAAVLSGHTNGQNGLAIIVHRGLTAWIGELMSKVLPATSSPPISGLSTRPNGPIPAPNELTRVLAGIIVALTTGDAAAHA